MPDGFSTRATLVQAFAYLAGVRGHSADEARADAVIVADWLRGQGLRFAPVVHDSERCPPETLRKMREGLGLTPAELSQEAGISERSIYAAERSGSRAHRASVDAIVSALERLGGRLD